MHPNTVATWPVTELLPPGPYLTCAFLVTGLIVRSCARRVKVSGEEVRERLIGRRVELEAEGRAASERIRHVAYCSCDLPALKDAIVTNRNGSEGEIGGCEGGQDFDDHGHFQLQCDVMPY